MLFGDDAREFAQDIDDAAEEAGRVDAYAFRRSQRVSYGPPVCPYCSVPTALVGGDVVYPHRPDLAEKRFWLCHPCDAYVGCHPGTERPLGTPAKAVLRGMRSRVHAALDPLWRTGKMRRNEVYARLASEMGIPSEECHVGMFDADRCVAAQAAIKRMAG